MADQGMRHGSRSGPGNKAIAMALLEALAVRGEAVSHARAVRALELAVGELAKAKDWLASSSRR